MRAPEINWERLVREALCWERLGAVVSEQQPVGGGAGNAPPSLTNNTHIDEWTSGDKIDDEDHNIARILNWQSIRMKTYSMVAKVDALWKMIEYTFKT